MVRSLVAVCIVLVALLPEARALTVCPLGADTPTTKGCPGNDACGGQVPACNGGKCINAKAGAECSCNSGQATASQALTVAGPALQSGDGVVQVAIHADYAVGLTASGEVVDGPKTLLGKQKISDAAQVAAGEGFGLALTTGGSVIGWGAVAASTPPDGLANVARVAAGPTHALALHTDGTVTAWGDNAAKQLFIPEIQGKVYAIAAATGASAALLEDGSIVAWGAGAAGSVTLAPGSVKTPNGARLWLSDAGALVLQTDGTILVAAKLTKVPEGLTSVVDLSGGPQSGAAVLANGTAVSWGATPALPKGQSGLIGGTAGVGYLTTITEPTCGGCPPGSTAGPGGCVDIDECFAEADDCPKGTACVNAQPGFTCQCPDLGTEYGRDYGFFEGADHLRAPDDENHLKHIGVGPYAAIGTRDNGTVVVWGLRAPSLAPPAGLSQVTAAYLGVDHGVALKADGSAVHWANPQSFAYGAVPPAGPYVAIASGNHFAMGLRANGTVSVWGANPGVQPVLIPAGIGTVIAIDAVSSEAALLTDTGDVVVVGSGLYAPLNVPSAVDVAIGGDVVLVLKADGTLVGHSAVAAPNHPAATIPVGLPSSVVEIAAGAGTALARLSTGDVWQWGHQVTAGPLANQKSVVGLSSGWALHTLRGGQCEDIDECALGQATCPALQHCVNAESGWDCECDDGYASAGGGCVDVDECALETDDCHDTAACLNTDGGYECTLACAVGFGPAPTGQLVNWLGVELTAPADIEQAQQASAEGDVHAVLMKDGTVRAWGTLAVSQVPAGLSGVKQVSAGEGHIAALKDDGTLVTWGDNALGQLGNAMLPSAVVDVAASAAHTVALLDTGAVVAWGDNAHGQSAVPALPANVVHVAAGDGFSAVVTQDGRLYTWGALAPTGSVPYALVGYDRIEASGHTLLATTNQGGQSVITAWVGATGLAWEFVGPSTYDTAVSGSRIAVLYSASVWFSTSVSDLILWSDAALFGPFFGGTLGDFGSQSQHNEARQMAGASTDLTLILRDRCEDFDECAEVECGANAVCVDGLGSYTCECAAGFAFNGTVCTDIDECVTGTHDCDAPNQQCINTIGGFDCDCGSGYQPAPGNLVSWNETAGLAIPAVPNAVMVAGGHPSGVAVLDDGSVIHWGAITAFGPPPANGAGWTQLDVGDAHAIALKADGTIVTWGDDASGQVTIPTLPGLVKRVAAGPNHSLVVTTLGDIATWGANDFGELTIPPNAYGWDCDTTERYTVCADHYSELVIYGAPQQAFTDLPAPYAIDVVLYHQLAAGDSSILTRTWGWDPATNTPIYGVKAFGAIAGQVQTVQNTYWPFSALEIDADKDRLGVRMADGRFFAFTDPTSPVLQTTRVLDIAMGGGHIAAKIDACEDIDECVTLAPACGPNSTCVNWPGTYFCPCDNGFQTGPNGCEDINECQYGNGPCPVPGSVCVNTAPGWTCDCTPGYGPAPAVWYGENALWVQLAVGLNPNDIVDIDGWNNQAMVALSDGSAHLWTATVLDPPAIGPLNNVVQVAQLTGGGVAMHQDGSTTSWGPVAVGVPANTTAVQITGGHALVAARLPNGTVEVWGYPNQAGQYDPPPGLTGVVDVAAGLTHVVALKSDGTVVSWPPDVGMAVPAGLTGVADVTAGADMSAALLNDGSVQVWGSGAAVVGHFTAPDPIVEWASDLDSVAGITSTGEIVSFGGIQPVVPNGFVPTGIWGQGYYYGVFGEGGCFDVDECADGTATCDSNATCTNTPGSYECDCLPGFVWNAALNVCEDIDDCAGVVPPCGPNAKCVNLAPGYDCTCPAGFVYSPQPFVINETGVPQLDPPALGAVAAVSGGHEYALALRVDGTVGAWGDASGGQLQVPPGLVGASDVTAGDHFGLALLPDGTTLGWGQNPPPPLTDVSAVSAEGDHALVLYTDGTVAAFGDDTFGQATPPAMPEALGVAAGAQHSLVRLGSGSVVAFGRNDDGESTVPAGLTTVVDVGAGAATSAAVLADGSVVAWGRDPGGLFAWLSGVSNAVLVELRGEYAVLWHDNGEISTWSPGVGGIARAHLLDASPTDLGAVVLSGPDCADLNECLEGVCPPLTVCTNLPGSYACECAPGTIGVGDDCKDIDECADETHTCGPGETCVNEQPGFSCVVVNADPDDPIKEVAVAEPAAESCSAGHDSRPAAPAWLLLLMPLLALRLQRTRWLGIRPRTRRL